MSFFSNWLGGYLLKRGVDALLSFRATPVLWDRVAEVMEAWRGDLPAGSELDTNEALFNPRLTTGLNDLPDEPKAVIDSIANGVIPTVDDWAAAFLQQWNYVRTRLEEPQNFFLIVEADAKTHCKRLAEKVHAECVKDSTLFQQDVHRKVADLQTEVAELLAIVKPRDGDEKRTALGSGSVEPGQSEPSRYHVEIEQAWGYIKKSQPDIAIVKLNELESRHSDLTPRERYRIAANRGLALQEKDKFEEAAKEFIACKVYDPTYEKARCFEASGYFMLGDAEKCYKLAQGILADNPECVQAYSLLVRSAPEEIPFSEVEALVPERHRRDEDVLFALSMRALIGRLIDAAEHYARQLCQTGEPTATAKAHLGGVLVDSTITRIAPLLSDSPPVDSVRLNEAISLLEDAIKRFIQQGARESEGRCHYHLGRAYDFLGDEDRAEVELRAAHDANPSEVRFTAQLAIRLYDKSKPERAIELLREVQEKDESLSVPTMLAQMLRKQGSNAHRDEAIAILEGALTRFPGPGETANSEFIDTLTSLYQQASRFSDAESLLEEVGTKLGEVERLALVSAVKRRNGEADAARDAIIKAVASLTEETENWHRHLIVRELIQQDMYKEAFDLLQGLVPTSCIALDTSNLVACAQRIGRDDFLLDFLSSLRSNGVFDAQFIDLELGLREHYHAGEQCVNIIQGLLAANAGDDEFRRELRVRLSFLGLNYDRPDLIETDIDMLPQATNALPYLGFLVVQLLCQQERLDDAREYAYTLVRGNVNSHWTYKALIGSYLIEKNAGPIQKPEVVAVGTAVQYRDDMSGELSWAILEDGPKPDMSRLEFLPDHHIFKGAIGKGLGDKFFVSRGVQDRTATIIGLLDKKVYRFNACLEEYPTRFDDGFLSAVRMPKDDQGELDLSPIVKSLKKRAEEVERLDEMYMTHPFSAVMYSVTLQGTIVDVFRHLSGQGLPIRCCRGSEAEHKASGDFLSGGGVRLVIDPSASATMALTGSYNCLDKFKKLGIELIVTRGLMVRLRSAIENEQRFSGNGALAYVDSRLVLFETTPEEKALRVKELENLLDALRANATIVDGLPLARIAPQLRENMKQLFGWDTAEAIAVAVAMHAGIWTDDYGVAGVAASEHNTPRVWTEAMMRWAHAKNAIGLEDIVSIAAKLVQLGYYHTVLTPNVARKLAEDGAWDIRSKPFSSAIKWLENPSVDDSWISLLAEQLLPEIYHRQSEFKGSITVQDILGSIGSRPNGRAIIRELSRRIGVVCGIDFQAANRLTQDIDMWLETNKRLST